MPRKTYIHNLTQQDGTWMALADVPKASCVVVYHRDTGEIDLTHIEGNMKPWWKTAIKRTFKHMVDTIQAGGDWDNGKAEQHYMNGKLGHQHGNIDAMGPDTPVVEDVHRKMEEEDKKRE